MERNDEMIWREVFVRRMDSMDKRQEEVQMKLEENTEATTRIEASTREVVQLLESMKGAARILELIAKVFKPIGVLIGVGVSVWGMVSMIKGGGK